MSNNYENAAKLLQLFGCAKVSALKINVWLVSLKAIKTKYAKLVKKKPHLKEDVTQLKQVISLLKKVETKIS